MATPASTTTRPHVVVFPFMAKGHTIPLIHLTIALTRRGVAVTFLTTPANSPFVESHLLPNPDVRVVHLPFPVEPSLPEGCESTDQLPSMQLFVPFVRAAQRLEGPFHSALDRMSRSGALPLCVVSDFFLWWTVPVCAEFAVPRLVCHGMGVFSMSVLKSLWADPANHRAAAALVGSGRTFHVPGTPDTVCLTEADLPSSIAKPDDPLAEVIAEIGRVEPASWGVVINSFGGLEERFIPLLRTFYLNPERVWLVGPLSDINPANKERLNQWLDDMPAGSVLYVSFGTQAEVPDAQLDEIAHGLEASRHHYMWVVRSPTWSAPQGTGQGGLVVREWVSQRSVLEHSAMGGFLSHCGWNSTLESVAAGVPILAWPMIAEQQLNAKFVVEQLGMGLRVPAARGGLVGREEIRKGVSELMGGRKGERARQRARELSKMAKDAVAPGGSSFEALNRLVKELVATRNRPRCPSYHDNYFK